MPPIKELPEEENETPAEQRVQASAAESAAKQDPDSRVLTSKGALELIYSEIRTAAIEDEEYDPHKLVAEAKTMALKEGIKKSAFPGAETAATYFGAAEPTVSQPESSRAKPTGLCERASTFWAEMFPNKTSSFAHPEPASGTTQHTPSAGTPPGSALPLQSNTASNKRDGSSYPSPSVAGSFQPESPREALLQGSTTGAESTRPGSEHAEPNQQSRSAADPASTTGSDREFPPPFTRLAVTGGPSKMKARSLLQPVGKFIYESGDNDTTTAAPTFRMERLVDIVKQHGWMLLCICAHSKSFHELIGVDDKSWTAIYKRIAKNVASIELYAAHCKLDWQLYLPPKARLETHPKTHYLTLDGRKVISLTKGLYSPEYRGMKQVEIEENFYRDPVWVRRKPRTTREAGECDCALCGSRQLCPCEIPNDARALVELREYPNGRGVGVRSLRAVKASEFFGVYLGELFSPPLRDPAWVVEQMSPGDNSIATISMIDAAVHGTWARYLNHSCGPAAGLVSTAVGETLCVLVRAIKDIAMFDEITVDYGPEYFEEEEGRVCTCGEEECRYSDGGEGKGKGKEKAEQRKAPAEGRRGGGGVAGGRRPMPKRKAGR